MEKNRSTALDHILKHEGGFAVRAEEGGGAVNRGVTLTTFVAWRRLKKMSEPSVSDLKAMGLDETKEIYGKQYADPVRFDELPSGVDYAVLDAAVHSGVTGSIKFLQEALGFKGAQIDGHLGAATLWGAKSRKPAELINRLVDVREARQRKMRNWEKFSANWIRRNKQVRAAALAMVGGK